MEALPPFTGHALGWLICLVIAVAAAAYLRNL